MRALQALHRDCAGGRSWQSWTPGVWEKVPDFSGTRSDWDTVCAIGSELDCDSNGRVTLIHVTQFISFYCPLGLPMEFCEMSELSHIQMDQVLRASGGLDVAHIIGPLLSLTNLRVISFAKNSLTGVMPALCNFDSFSDSATKLEKLMLGYNALTGRLATALGCLTQLEELDVTFNQLTGELPDTWASMRNLKTLRLSSNEALGGTIPTAWFASSGGMNKLVTLEAEWCGLTGTIPTDFGALNNLETVKLNYNSLTGSLPASVASLVNLKVLYISRNQFSGSLPANLFTALNRWLEDVDLSNNMFTGAIPQMSTDWPAITKLDLSNNYLEGSIPSLTSISGMSTLTLANNRLNGSIPDLSRCYYLSTLQLQHNAFEGALPDLSRSSMLITIDMSTNGFSSGLGTWLGTNKPSLTSVNVASNNLTGELPSTLCYARLQTLDLRGNNLWGTVPESIASCTQLVSLHLGTATHNLGRQQSLSGASALPSSSALAKLTRLTELSFAGLGLVGALPTSLFSLPALEHLDLSHNNLTGALPEVTAGGLEDLVSLKLEGNKLTGLIPASLLTLPRLLELLLTDNLISGVQSTSSTIKLVDLHLAGNSLAAFPAVVGLYTLKPLDP